MPRAGMGVDAADYDNSGIESLVVTNFDGQYDVAQWNSEGRLVVAEATLYRGAFRFWTREKDGSDPKERTIWRRYGKERFEVTLERREGDRWRTVKTTAYDRVPGKP